MGLLDFFQGASNAAAGNVSGPVDAIAWALRKAGVPVGDAPMGSSQWMAQMGLTRPANGYAGLLGEAAGLSMPIVAAAKAPQIARGLLSLDDKAMDMTRQGVERAMLANGGIQPATVWHGSPHKFDKFDSSKIGTGEGAQAYGHGLYLAESPSVAKSYADSLSQYHIATKDGVRGGGDFADALVANAGEYPASLSSAIRSQANKIATDIASGKPTEQVLASMRNGPYARMYAGLADAVEKLAPSKAGGSLYKVDLPDDAIARMLDWDKPLSQQAPKVQKAWQATKKALPQNAIDNLGGDLSLMYGKHVMPKDFLNTWASLGEQVGGESALHSQGIPGIRYLDGGSRVAGTGTSNYVIFPGNENMLTILERNGQPVSNLGLGK